MQTLEAQIDADLQVFVAKHFLPQLILAIATFKPADTLQQIALREYHISMRGTLYRVRCALYKLIGVKNPARMDSFQQPFARKELGDLNSEEYLQRDINAAFEALTARMLDDLLRTGNYNKFPVDDPARCAGDVRGLIHGILNP